MRNKIKGSGRYPLRVAQYALYVLLILLFSAVISYAQDTVNQLKEETLSYFKPLKGKVLSVNDKVITSDRGIKSGIKRGMRVTIFREGTPFLHPVTKEPMGRVETPSGKADVKEVNEDNSTLEIIKGDAKEGDIVRISEMKVRILFYQDRSVGWDLADAYYQLLKESGKFELVDTPLDSGDDATIMDEAKKHGAEAALFFSARESGNETILRQRILWVEDSSKLFETEVKVDSAVTKALRSERSMLAPLASAEDALLFFDLPFRARLIAVGDIKGDGTKEIIISTGRDLEIYALGSSLNNLYRIRGSVSDDYLWLDTMDINGDGKDEIIVTSMKNGEVVSYIYELKNSEFSLLWKEKLFLRVAPSQGLIAQKYDGAEGFSGPVFGIAYRSGEFKMGDALKLPKGVNIYDFAPMDGPDGARYILAYDDWGYLNLYNSEGLRVWRSKESFGGFLSTFKKTASTVMVDKGEWSVKDRLSLKNREAFVVKRIALADMAKGLGYKSSQMRTLWWTGLSMEEGVLIEGISGGIMDYAVTPDRLIVLSKPLFGIKPKNILKGENPLGSMLYIYSIRGK